MRTVVLALTCVACVACVACGESSYTCIKDAQCVIDDIVGVCQPIGHCSFPDEACDSGQRYAERAGEHARQCVPTSDGTGSEASGTTSTADDGSVTASSTTAPSTSSTSTSSTSTPSTSTPSTSTGDPTSETTDLSTSSTDDSSTGEPPDPEPLVRFSFESLEPEGIPNLGSLGGVALCDSDTCPTLVEGPFGLAASFDGIDDCAALAHVPEFAQIEALTLAAWIERGAIGADYDGVLCKPVGDLQWNSWRLATYDAPGGPVADFRVGHADNTGLSLPSAIPLRTWVHVVGTWDGETMQLWIDGALVEEGANSLLEVDDQPLLVGCDDDHDRFGITNHLAGTVDELRLYARALDAGEIAALYALGP